MVGSRFVDRMDSLIKMNVGYNDMLVSLILISLVGFIVYYALSISDSISNGNFK